MGRDSTSRLIENAQSKISISHYSYKYTRIFRRLLIKPQMLNVK